MTLLAGRKRLCRPVPPFMACPPWRGKLVFRPSAATTSCKIALSFGPKLNITKDSENQQETYLHLLVFNTLLEASLDAAASRDLIIQIAESHWRGSP